MVTPVLHRGRRIGDDGGVPDQNPIDVGYGVELARRKLTDEDAQVPEPGHSSSSSFQAGSLSQSSLRFFDLSRAGRLPPGSGRDRAEPRAASLLGLDGLWSRQ